MDTQELGYFLCAAVFVTVVWVLPRIASDFGVSILWFAFLCRNFGHPCCLGICVPPEYKWHTVLAKISASLSELYFCTVV